MSIYVPVDIQGEGLNVSFAIPFTPTPPAINKGTWLGVEETMRMRYPDAELIIPQEPTWICAGGGISHMAFTINPEYLADFTSSSAQCLIVGDIVDGTSAWVDGTDIDGQYTIASGPLQVKPGVTDPKVRIFIHNNTATYLASELLDFKPFNEPVVTSPSDVPYTDATPLIINNVNDKSVVKIRSNADFLKTYKSTGYGEIENNYPVKLTSIQVELDHYVYTFEISPRTDELYGTDVNLLFAWQNLSRRFTRLPIMVLVSGGVDAYFTLPTTSRTVDYKLFNGLSYKPTSDVAGSNVSLACTIESQPALDSHVVKVFTHPQTKLHPNIFHLPLSTGGATYQRVVAMGRGVAKDTVVATYTVYDSNDEELTTHNLTWADLYATTGDDTITYLELSLVEIPSRLRLTYDLNGEGDTFVNFIFQIEHVSYTMTTDLLNGNIFKVRPVIIGQESVEITLVPKFDDYVNQRMSFDPSSVSTVNQNPNTYPTVQIIHRTPTVQEILNALH